MVALIIYIAATRYLEIEEIKNEKGKQLIYLSKQTFRLWRNTYELIV